MLAAAAIALVATLIPKGTEEPKEPNMVVVPEPTKSVAIPIIGTAVEFQSFQENFEETQKGWNFNKTAFLDNGRLILGSDQVNTDVHTFINSYYQIGKGAYSISARIGYVSGPDWTYGIVLKKVGAQDFLFFSLRKSGYYRITRFANNSWRDLTKWAKLPDGISENTQFGISNILLDSSRSDDDHMSNLLQLEPKSAKDLSKLYFYADKAELTSVQNFLAGDPLQFGLFSSLNIRASFDDLKVYDFSYINDLLPKGSCLVHAGEEYCP